MNEKIKEQLGKIDKFERDFAKEIAHKRGKADAEEYFKRHRLKTCTKADEENLLKWAHEIFPETNADLKGFIEFSRCANGLEYNDLSLYSINPDEKNNIYEENDGWRYGGARLAEYMFFGDSSISWYCFDHTDNKYWILDKGSGTPIDEFDTLCDLLEMALKVAFNEYTEDD